MSHIVVAAAVPEGALVRLDENETILIDVVENGSPRPGKITWIDKDGTAICLPANKRMEVISFDRPQES